MCIRDSVEEELSEKNPNLKLKVTYKQMPNYYPGYIIEQSGHDIGDKLDPDKEETLKVVVTQLMSFKIDGIVGKTVAEATSLIEEKTGIPPVTIPLDYNTLSEEEQAKTKKGVVVKVDPSEGLSLIHI